VKLLKTIETSINFASPPAGTAEIIRQPMEIPEGRVTRVVVGIQVLTTVSGGSKSNIYSHSALTSSDALTNADANTEILLNVPEIGGAANLKSLRTSTGSQFLQAFWGGTYGVKEILSPYTVLRWDHDRTAGTLNLNIYLFGEPRRYSEMPYGTVE